MIYAAIASVPVLFFGVNLPFPHIYRYTPRSFINFQIKPTQPASGGSGIAEVMGYLNGISVPDTISLKTFIGKITSIIFSFSSSLALGPEGE
jgi:H+/Cl- antiporter ClcA